MKWTPLKDCRGAWATTPISLVFFPVPQVELGKEMLTSQIQCLTQLFPQYGLDFPEETQEFSDISIWAPLKGSSSTPFFIISSAKLAPMSTPAEYYRSLPPVTKAYGVLCLMTTAASYLQLYDYEVICLSHELVFKKLQIWRLVTNFFFLAPFSAYFGLRLIMLARYGVLLEKGPFKQRTADFLWMMIFGALSLLVLALIPTFRYPFMGPSLVFMILYVWSREVPESQINIFGLLTMKGFYLPWAMLALDLIFNNPLKPDIMGILAGHLYYFLAVLFPLSGGRNILKTPLWVHKLVAYWGKGAQMNSPVRPDPHAAIAFRGRSYRLNQ